MKYELISIFSNGREVVSPPMSLEQGLQIYSTTLKIPVPVKIEGRTWSTAVDKDEIIILRPVGEEEERFGGPIMVDDLVDAMSDERLDLAFKRAFGNCVADYESREFHEELATQLKMMVVKDAVASLVKKGYLVSSGVDKDGDVRYNLTEQGKQILEGDPDGKST